MVTKIKELRTQRGMTQQQLADLVQGAVQPLPDAQLPHGQGVRRHRGGALLPGGEFEKGG